MPGIFAASTLPRPEQAERPHRHGVGDQLGPLGAVDVAGRLDLADVAQDGLDLLQPRRVVAVELADAEPGRLVRGVALDLARREDFRRQLERAADHALAADDGGDRVVVEAVLHRHQHAVGLQIRLDQFGEPAVVVRLDRQQHDVEFEVGRGEFAQVQRADRRFHLAVRHADDQAVGLEFFDLRRPLVDDGDVESRLGQIRADAAADGAGADYCDFLVHAGSIDCLRLPRAAALFLPGVAQRHRAVEHRRAGLRVAQVGDEVAVPLELEALFRLARPSAPVRAAR